MELRNELRYLKKKKRKKTVMSGFHIYDYIYKEKVNKTEANGTCESPKSKKKIKNREKYTQKIRKSNKRRRRVDEFTQRGSKTNNDIKKKYTKKEAHVRRGRGGNEHKLG